MFISKRMGLALGLFLLGSLFATLALAGSVRQLSPAESSELLQKRPGLYLLDVRTPGEYLQVRIDGAHLIPIDQIVSRLGELPKQGPILVYCAVGSRSSQVADYLVNHGFGEVYNMYGGVMGWQVRGYPVLQGAP